MLRYFIILFTILIMAPVQAARLALVIGNNDYRYESTLHSPVNDARDMAKLLRRFGFTVIDKYNLTQRAFDQVVQSFEKKLHNYNVGLFYYSGHGLQSQGDNYLVPIDARIRSAVDIKYTSINANQILDKMEYANKHINLLILDACRNNPYKSIRKGFNKGLAEMSPRGSLIAFATAPKMTALDGTERNSIYTKHLLRQLRTQPYLSVVDLLTQVAGGVAKETKQKQWPWMSASLTKQFCFGACGYSGDAGKLERQQAELERQRVELERQRAQLKQQRIEAEQQRVQSERAKIRQDTKLDEAKRRKLAQNLRECKGHFQANRLTTGRGATALACYKDVLRLDANNSTALRGLASIEERYVKWAERALKKGQKSKVRKYLASLRMVNPNSLQLVGLESQLESMSTPTTGFPSQQIISNQARVPGDVFQDRLKDGGLGPEMVVIPKGRFQMGDIQGGRGSNEKPVHWVDINYQFAMGKYEVTFVEYDKFAQATGRKKPSDRGWGRGRRPVINVSWKDANAYTKWLSRQTNEKYRLPSEAEWEYAARAGTKTKYWWGNNIGKNKANCYGCGSRWDNKQTAPVGSFRANQFGLYDTVGNVYEWVTDNYQKSYNGAPSYGSAWKKASKYRVLRGGSWLNNPDNTRAAFRYGYYPDFRNYFLGFRVVRRVARTY
jgi:formylglycine-generating enzyme required for sulfatase activity